MRQRGYAGSMFPLRTEATRLKRSGSSPETRPDGDECGCSRITLKNVQARGEKGRGGADAHVRVVGGV